MASVCGGCLALQDAGVPIKCSIAGIAMGMVLDTKEFGGDGSPIILSDITGSEDASGDMDFKVSCQDMDFQVNFYLFSSNIHVHLKMIVTHNMRYKVEKQNVENN